MERGLVYKRSVFNGGLRHRCGREVSWKVRHLRGILNSKRHITLWNLKRHLRIVYQQRRIASSRRVSISQ